MPNPRFLVDADMPKSSTELLKKHGFNAKDVRDVGLASAEDKQVMEFARSEKRILVTRNLGFGNPERYPSHPGAIIFRLPHTYTAAEINERLEKFLSTVDVEKLSGNVVIVERDRFRVRRV